MPGLTKRRIDRLTWDPDGEPQQIEYDDAEGRPGIPGFGVRVYESGAKSFVLWIRTQSGRKRLATLGKVGILTLDQAKAKARRFLVEVAEGKDPVEERRRERLKVETFGQLADRYLEDHAKRHRKTWPEDKRRIEKHLKPKLGRIAALDVTAADVRALHAAIGKRAPVEANRVLSLVRAIFNKARRWELVPPDHPNPAESVDRFKERSRERWLTATELKRLAKALVDEEDVYSVAAIRLLLLTGSRKTELLRARWDRLDLEGRRLLLEDTKTGEPKTVALSEPALTIIRGLPRALHSPWVFPSPKDAQKPRRDVRRAWERIRKAARIENATVHDLRRTAGSWLVQQGVPLKVIGAALGHRDTRATEVYARIAADQPAEALEMLGEAFGQFADPEHAAAESA